MKDPLVPIQLHLTELKNIVQVLYDHGTAKHVDVIRALEAAIDDAMLEFYEDEEQHQ